LVEVTNGNIDRAMKDMNRVLQLNGVVAEVKARGHYLKPCEKRNAKKAERLVNIKKYRSKKPEDKKSKYNLSALFSTSF
jgi:ribosomal protein S21